MPPWLMCPARLPRISPPQNSRCVARGPRTHVLILWALLCPFCIKYLSRLEDSRESCPSQLQPNSVQSPKKPRCCLLLWNPVDGQQCWPTVMETQSLRTTQNLPAHSRSPLDGYHPSCLPLLPSHHRHLSSLPWLLTLAWSLPPPCSCSSIHRHVLLGAFQFSSGFSRSRSQRVHTQLSTQGLCDFALAAPPATTHNPLLLLLGRTSHRLARASQCRAGRLLQEADPCPNRGLEASFPACTCNPAGVPAILSHKCLSTSARPLPVSSSSL